MSKTDHAQRTATEPRDAALHTVTIRQVDQINDHIRIFRLGIPPSTGSIKFLPGQWLDTFVPGLSKPGGFTITSPPSAAVLPAQKDGAGAEALSTADTPGPSSPAYPYLELAIQKSPDNPAAQYLWRDDPPTSLLGTELRVRVGGSFVWPPPTLPPPDLAALRRVVFVAGGVGVNPLMSMVSHLAELPPGERGGCDVRFLYSMRDPGPEGRTAGAMLFLERLAAAFGRGRLRGQLRLFLTGGSGGDEGEGGVIRCGDRDVPFLRRRISKADLADAVGEEKGSAVVYICGLPTMTDEFVEELTSPTGLGMDGDRVLCERWW
ncbi:Oxidoreductase NAD-binding domain-containing protein 1 [Pleurostoma richardsiae]|uniref:Oxidoreductase NAD-binding domain-containing protein 1 n=1 Tax=Pleurostoma richardsiae TaxID=41990 RepID=A0AA38RJ85_9PEZI|nr:Oxidoreductase NAD-binding domain-containing protein 1 [Pleurostoma richardsiae]